MSQIDPALAARLRAFLPFADDTEHMECHVLPGQDGTIGVYSNTQGDHGGPTRWGCTQATVAYYLADPGMQPLFAALDDTASVDWLAAVAGRDLTDSDIATLPQPVAGAIYFRGFYTAPHIDLVPGNLLREEVFDTGVGSGPARAIKILQQLVNVAQDGVLGPATLAAVDDTLGRYGEAGAIAAYIALREHYYADIVAADPAQAKFAAGWQWRAAALQGKLPVLETGRGAA